MTNLGLENSYTSLPTDFYRFTKPEVMPCLELLKLNTELAELLDLDKDFLLSEDGTMARAPELMTFAKQHKLKIITIEDLIAYRLKTETLIRRTAEATLPTMHGQFQLISYESITDGEMHTALHKEKPLLRLMPLKHLRNRSQMLQL